MDSSKVNFEPDKETSAEFKNAVTVSGVSTPKLMYSLHKRFSQIEIEEAYHEITEIQVRLEITVSFLKLVCFSLSNIFQASFFFLIQREYNEALAEHTVVVAFFSYCSW